MAGLFQVLFGKSDGTFRKAEVLKGTDGQPLIIAIADQKQQTENICTRPFAADWDGDSHIDLVVGNFSGTFYWFKGEGTGKFEPKAQIIETDGSPVRINGAHSDPFVIDWDGDGDLDLLSGSSNGGVFWAKNRAGKGKTPVLEAFAALIQPGRQVAYGEPLREDDLKGPTTSTRIWVDDCNADGKLDILVGDSVTLVSPAKGLSVDEFKKRHAEWQEEFRQVSQAFQAGGDAKAQEELSRKYQDVYQKRSTFMTEDRTGFVWLYLQK